MAVGPVDVYIIGFPGNKFTGRIAPAIMELVENGTIRVLDLLFVMKDADGVVTTLEAADIDEEGAAFLSIDVTQPGALGPEDAEEVSDDLPANSSALLIAFENLWVGKVVDALQAADAVADRLDPDPGRRRRPRSRQARPRPLRDREVTRWDFYVWQPARRSSREPPPPCPGACSVVRPPGTTSRTRSSTRRQQRSHAPEPPAAGGRLDRTAPEPGAAAHPGRAHRRGVRGRQGQDPRNLTGRPRPSEAGRGVLAAGRGLRRDRRRPLPRPLGLVPPRALECRPGGRALRARSLLRHRPPRGRADRTRLPGRRSRRIRRDAGPRSRAPRPRGGVEPDDAPRPRRSTVSSTRRSARSTASTTSLRTSCG